MSYPPVPQMQQQGYPPVPQMQQPMAMAPMGGGEWMPAPAPQMVNCPPTLAYLTQVDHLLVKQQLEMLEAFIGFETSNKYKIKNSLGQTVFLATEDTDCCTRNMCGPLRPFDLKIMDNAKNELIHINRPLACDSCLCPCSMQSLEVSSPPGTLIGTVEKEWSIMTPKFAVKDASGNTVLRIEGPLCTFAMCGTIEFEVLSADRSVQVGKISKEWSGLAKELFTDGDKFGVSFPLDLDVKIKAVLLGAVFLIDFLYFERSND